MSGGVELEGTIGVRVKSLAFDLSFRRFQHEIPIADNVVLSSIFALVDRTGSD